MEYIMEVSGLKKYFKDIRAVDGISFQVEKGELFGFLGVNGAGKSTTINMLCALFPPTEGGARICGHILGKEDEKIRRRIGVVWQGNCLDKKLTVKENLYVRGALYGLGRKELKENVDRTCGKLGLSDIFGRRYEHLSGGQKRRCEIAAALVNTPEVLFLDEPTTGLDPATRQQVWSSLEEMRAEEGVTIFLTTHYMEEAAKANHIAVMDGGQIRETGTPFDLKERFAKDKLKLIPAPGKAEELEGFLRHWEGGKKEEGRSRDNSGNEEVSRSQDKSGNKEGSRSQDNSKDEEGSRGQDKTGNREGSRNWDKSGNREESRSQDKSGNEEGSRSKVNNRRGKGIETVVWKDGYFLVELSRSLSALPVLKEAEACLQGFELVQGSMDDVFLNITGKTLEKING